MADRVYVRGLLARSILGVNEDERRNRQDVLIDLDVWTDTRPAAATDRFEDAVDYRALKKRVLAYAEKSEHRLVETLANELVALCLEDPRVVRARVRVEKPGALRFARTVGVEVERERDAR